MCIFLKNTIAKELSKWLNEKQMEDHQSEGYMLMANLIGEKAADLEMLDTAVPGESL